MLHMHKTNVVLTCLLDGCELWLTVVIAPGPGVAEPERGEQVQRCRLGSTVGSAHTDQYIKRINLGIFHGDIEVAIFCEDACIHQFVFKFLTTTIAISSDKI